MPAYDTMSDTELLDAWKANDQQAGAVLFKRYYVNVARFFAYRVGPDSDDLVQETFLGLLARYEHFRGDASFRCYLFGIARNQLLQYIRDRVRDRDRFDPGEMSIAALDPSPSMVLRVKDDQKLLLAALRRLPIDVQIMLELHYWEKMKIKDIARVLEKNENTVKIQMKRGREKLDAEMEALAESKAQLQTTISGLSKWAAQLRDELDDAC